MERKIKGLMGMSALIKRGPAGEEKLDTAGGVAWIGSKWLKGQRERERKKKKFPPLLLKCDANFSKKCGLYC